MKKIIAQEWLKLIAGFIFGLLIIPPFVYYFTFVYYFISPERYPSKQSMADLYNKLFEMLFYKHIDDTLTALLIILGPYLLYQFIRSLVWAYKTSKS